MVSCREIMKLHTLEKADVVAGSGGLNRMVRWVHFIDLPDVLPWVQGGELLIITGIGLPGGPAGLVPLVKGVIEKKLAGMIINLGPYIETVPAEVIEIAEKANFPLLTLPWNVKLVEVMQEISSYIVVQQTEKQSLSSFFEQLLLKPVEAESSLLEHAAAYGYDLSQPQQAVLVGLSHQKQEEISDFMQLKTQMEQVARDFFVRKGRKVLLSIWMDKILFLLPQSTGSNEQENIALVQELVEILKDHFAGVSLAAGMGSPAKSLPCIRDSYQQAGKALWFGASAVTKRDVYDYDSLGIYKLLLEVPLDRLQAYCHEIIGTLEAHDAKYKMDLINSLFVYFEETGNAVKTAHRLFVHRNTLDYRLKKIEEVSGKKLSNSYDRLMLQLAVVIARQLNTVELATEKSWYKRSS